MIEISVAYNRYKFLGNEFLTWVWFLIETDPDLFRQCDPDVVSLEVGNRIVLENRNSGGLETISIKGDAAGLEEAILALNKGAAVTELSLIYKSGAMEWQFAVKGENLSFSGLKLPETGAAETAEDQDGLILDRLYLYEKPVGFVDALYQRFIQARLSEKWSAQVVSEIKKWLNSSR